MLDKVNKLFEAIRPVRLAQDLGFTIFKHSNGSYFIQDSKANKKPLFLKDYEFVSPDRFPDFKAANIVSFIVKHADKTFEEAIDHIFTFYYNKLESPIFDELQWSKGLFASYLHDINLISDFLHKGKKDLLDASNMGLCRSYLRKYCDDINYAIPMVSSATGAQLNILFESLKNLESLKSNIKNTKKYENTKFLILPIYANYSTPTYLKIINPETEKSFDVDVTTHDRGIFGLHSVSPESSCVYILDDNLKVINAAQKYFNHGLPVSQSCISINKKAKGTHLPPTLKRGLMVIDETTELDKILFTHNSFQDLGLITKAQLFKISFEQSREARTHVLNNFISLIAEGGTSNEKFLPILNTIKKDPITFDRVQKQLQYLGRADILALMESSELESEINNINGNIILTTKDGYIAQSLNKNVQFTNFTLKLREARIFRDSSDVYYSGQVTMGGYQFPFIISKRESTHVRGIISAAIYSITSHKSLEKCEIKTPALLDTTFSSTLRNIVSREINNAAVKIGVNRLGWSSDYTRFQGPTWACTGGEVESKTSFKHPRVKSLRNFEWQELRAIVDKEIKYNHQSANTLVALITGMLSRTFLNLKVTPILVQNTKENRLILASALNVFGQTRTEEINPNVRNEISISGLDGYPLVCACASRVLSRLKFPAFVLSDDGHSFGDNSIDSVRLKEFCNFYFPHLINFLIRTNGKQLDPSYSNNDFFTLVSEGLRLMRIVIPDVNWQVTTQSHGCFGEWISKIPIDEFKKLVKLDFKNQKIRFWIADASSIKIKDLTEYLTAHNIEFKHQQNQHRYLIIDADKITPWLSDIFIEMPAMGTFELKTPKSSNEQKDSDNVGTG